MQTIIFSKNYHSLVNGSFSAVIRTHISFKFTQQSSHACGELIENWPVVVPLNLNRATGKFF